MKRECEFWSYALKFSLFGSLPAWHSYKHCPWKLMPFPTPLKHQKKLNTLCWVDPGWMLGTHQVALSLPILSRTGRTKQGGKKLIGQDHESLMKKKQRPATEAKEKQKFYSLVFINRWCPATSREAGLQ